MIDFSLTDAQREVQRTAQAFAEREILPRIHELDEAATYDRSLYEKMGAEGFLGLPIPEQYGGAGMDYIAFALLCEEMERADTAFRVILSVHTGLNSLTLLQWANEDQKQRYLVPQARGEKLATFGLTEPGVGSDAANLSTTARRDGDRYVLNGSKIWISLADAADNFLVFATVDKSLGHKGITAFIVERGYPGFSTDSLHGKLGVRAGNTGILYFNDCEVPAENRVGEEGEGFTIAMSAIDQGRYTVAAGSVGLAQACLDASVKYSHERRAFGDEIGRHQLVKQMLSRMYQGIEAGRLLVWKAGWRKNAGERNTRETSLAKWFATDHAVQCALDAIQIHGAYGYSSDYPVERYLRNSKGSVIYEGTSQIHTLMQADYLMGYRKDRPLRMPQPPFEGEM
jgi:glutaryl-CoA dehydrogenase (non-decarboxylating)